MILIEKQKFGIILPLVLVSYFLILLSNSVVFTSTVQMARDLNLTATDLAWVSNAYALTFGGLLLLAGRAGDLFGRKQLFIAGLIVFGIGSLVVGLAQNASQIIAARAFQGVGGAILAPGSLALLLDSYTGEMRTRAIAYYGATAGFGASIGLVAGGFFAALWTWRIGFLINVPIAIIAALISVFTITQSQKLDGKIDFGGALLSVLAMASLVAGIAYKNWIVIVLAFILLAAFVWLEKRVTEPILPLQVFANRQRSGAYIARFLYMGAMLSYWFLTPQALQNALHYSVLMAAIAFLPMTIPQSYFGIKAGQYIKKIWQYTGIDLGYDDDIDWCYGASICQHFAWLLVGCCFANDFARIGTGFDTKPTDGCRCSGHNSGY